MTRPSERPTVRTPKPTQRTLSVRIDDALRRRLERARQLMASTTGKHISMSTIAKQFLESGRENRLDVVPLLAHPTDALLEIRRRGEAQQLLSRAQWCVLVDCVRDGMEASSHQAPNPVSRDSMLTVLDAFLAVYDLRTERTSPRDAWYVGHLPSDCRPTAATRAGRLGHATADVVRRTVTETRRRVSDQLLDATPCVPRLAGQNLVMLLDDEPPPGLEAMNRALWPSWSGLWRLAARGHYVVTRQPVRERSSQRQIMPQPAIPSITEGPYRLSFAREGEDAFSVLLSFPGPRGPRYPVRGYPAITEFQAMLARLASGATQSWSGAHFAGGVADSNEHGPACWFRAHDNGITLRVSLEEWQSVRALVGRAWDLPDIRTAWDALAREYGEL
jgi:hypothetical protein